ncbi:IPT/TIG domain-containing protein [uncultured Dysgonomonas sp.]|uniref:IPT/TIG domain-containing protein n=1 Tax=uncultured Dysgonomonas sp. TaxID=206096 RepID=A0A212ITM9_9BACT|nr:IPT/TIG domain-containing protein [uncultured Dysgonomonas sp.]SBV90543.1 hypothetical protein KL86DYS1_10100 [uncultured Dysgonomonas sp.]
MKNLYIILTVFAFLSFCSCDDEIKEEKRGTTITSISPLEAKSGEEITITGTNFKNVNTNVVIFSGGIVAQVIEFSSNELIAIVPDSGVVSGPISVRVGVYEICESGQSFTIDKSEPIVRTTSPASGLHGVEVTIIGTNFAQSGNKVFFDNISAEVVKESEYRITVKVPEGLPTGKVNITVKSNNVTSNAISFDHGLVYSDTFNRTETDWGDKDAMPNPVGSPWTITKGKFRIQNQYLYTNNGGILYENSNALAKNDDGRSFKVAADFRIDVAAGTCWAGFILNAQNTDQFYLMRISGDSQVQLLRTSNGGAGWDAVIYNQVHNTIQGGDIFYHAEISSAAPGVFDIVISKQNGDILFNQTLSDPSPVYTGGYVGFMTEEEHSQFDNFEIAIK